MPSLMSLLGENAEPAKCKQLSLLWLIIRANSITKGQSLQQETRGRGICMSEGRPQLLSGGNSHSVFRVASSLGNGNSAWKPSPPKSSLAFGDHCSWSKLPNYPPSPSGAALGREVMLTGVVPGGPEPRPGLPSYSWLI